ncbi:DUF222 domain-containing protein [Actinopolymorpha pittospori]
MSEPGGVSVRVSPLPAGFADMLPGPGLLSALLAVSPGDCNGVELEELVRARRRLISWLEEGCLADVVELAHTPPGLVDDPAVRVGPVDPHTPALLEPLLGWTAYHADWYAALALTLTGLPRTRAALARGELEVGEVRVIAERLAELKTSADRCRVEDVLFPDVLGLRAGLLRMRVEAEVIKVDPDAALARHRRRVRDRDVEIYPAIDGAADLAVRGVPADQVAEAYGYVDAIARSMRQAGDPRRLGQLRADVATSLLSGRTHVHNPDPHDTGGIYDAMRDRGGSGEANGRSRDENDQACCVGADAGDSNGCDSPPGEGPAHTSGDGVVKVPAPRAPQPATAVPAAAAAEPSADPTTADPAAGAGQGGGVPRVGVRARIQLNVPLATLMGLSRRPGELGGFGPIVTEVARRLTLNQLTNPDARYGVGVTHPVTGQLLHLHPLPQRFLRGLQAELVHALNQRCVWPTCRRPASACDLDHNTPHAEGGSTTPANTAPLCPHHHTAKTESAWTLHQTTPGHYRLTNPHGRHHHTHPPDLTDPAPPPQLRASTHDDESDHESNNDDTDVPPF